MGQLVWQAVVTHKQLMKKLATLGKKLLPRLCGGTKHYDMTHVDDEVGGGIHATWLPYH